MRITAQQETNWEAAKFQAWEDSLGEEEHEFETESERIYAAAKKIYAEADRKWEDGFRLAAGALYAWASELCDAAEARA